MHVVVTGSAGFIGSRLCARLRAMGHHVIGLDKRTGGDAIHLKALLAEHEIGVVYHLAAETSVFNTRLKDILRENIEVLIEVVTACNEYGVKLVWASSSTANPCNTTSMYGMSKHFGEQFSMAYNPTATAVRLHNVYGPNPRPGTLLHHLLHDERCTIFNEGRNVRHFTYIDDIVDALIMASTCNKPLVNAANPELSTVREFCEEVAKHMHLNLDYVEQLRARDNYEQAVDKGVYTMPVKYRSIAAGLADVFRTLKTGEPISHSHFDWLGQYQASISRGFH